MGKRGKKSSADLAIVTDQTIVAIERPIAPAELTDEQRYEWLKVTNRMPADHFPAETHALLSQYCRHIVDARRIAQLIDAHICGENFGVVFYDGLLKMQEREGRAISSLATRMRLTQQTTQDRQSKNPASTPKPWQK